SQAGPSYGYLASIRPRRLRFRMDFLPWLNGSGATTQVKSRDNEIREHLRVISRNSATRRTKRTPWPAADLACATQRVCHLLPAPRPERTPAGIIGTFGGPAGTPARSMNVQKIRILGSLFHGLADIPATRSDGFNRALQE